MLPLIANGPGFNALVRAKHGLMLFNKNDIYIGRSIGKYGEFSELEVALFVQLCRPGDIVVEVGANIGSHTLPLAAMVGRDGRVHAFEPQRVVFQTLCANMALNSVANVECHRLALSNSADGLRLPDLPYEQENNFGAVELTRFTEGHPVPVARLDDTLDLPRCRLIKVDVEGMEQRVLEGARATIARHRPFLYVENDRQDKSDALIGCIEMLGYRLYWHTPPMFNPANFAGDAHNLFPDIISINMLGIPTEHSLEMVGFSRVNKGDHPLQSL
jgi:FkbM family methyltransferase